MGPVMVTRPEVQGRSADGYGCNASSGNCSGGERNSSSSAVVSTSAVASSRPSASSGVSSLI